MTNIIGYLRGDLNDKNIQPQLDLLKAAGASKIYLEKTSDKKEHTPQLEKLMSEVQEGDTLVVTSLDRIAHNTKHLFEVIESLYAAGVAFKAINNNIDTSSSNGEIIRTLLRALIDFERQVVKERQSVGIAKAKKEGRYKGRKPTARAKADEVLALNKRGLTKQKIADELDIGVASVYRILKDNIESKKPIKKITKNSKKTPTDKQKRVKRKPTSDYKTEQLSFF